MMDNPLDRLYLKWLYSKISSVRLRDPSRTYWNLFRQLYTKEFVWIIPNDDNRAEDGKDLRYEFLEEQGVEEVDPDWIRLGCSMLELLIALSRRLSFEDDGEPREWFWQMLTNLGLNEFNDANYNEQAQQEIDQALDTVIWRTYSPDGFGGLFPLKTPERDQREVEIWYQLGAYLLEHE